MWGHGKWLLERYVGRTVVTYLLLVLVFLTGALTTQQSGRLLEAVSATDAPMDAMGQTLAALLPTLLTLVVPMAVLLAVIISLSQLGSDSEIIAMQAAGLGVGVLAWPVMLLCAVVSLAGFYLNWEVAPRAARSLREIGLRAAKYKLESPLEPGAFNTEVPGYVLYIKGGDKSAGVWQQVFIYHKQANGRERLITARAGRIDFAGRVAQGSELFLSDAVMLSEVANANNAEGTQNYSWSVDHAAQTRLTFPTGREDVLERLQQRPFELDELSGGDLWRAAHAPPDAEQRMALVLWHKRLALSLAPLVMGLLGLSLGVRVRRGGRGAGLALGLLALTLYYLLSLVGEQMARKGTLPAWLGAWLAQCVACIFGGLWLSSRGLRFAWRGCWERWTEPLRRWGRRLGRERGLLPARAGSVPGNRGFSFPTHLDHTIWVSLSLVFLFSLGLLVLLFLTFTLFELWRFIVPSREGYLLMGRYLWYLMPLVLVQMLPGAGLIAALVTYAMMSRRLEAVAWWSSGQSTYRLMLPGLLFALLLGAGTWWIQERVMPAANVLQDGLRAQIKGSPKATTRQRNWLASATGGTLYGYEYGEVADELRQVVVFRFDEQNIHLREVIWAERGGLGVGKLQLRAVKSLKVGDGRAQMVSLGEQFLDLAEGAEVFGPSVRKASQLNTDELGRYVALVQGRGENVAALWTALQFKYTAPGNALVLILTGVPLALIFDRRRVLVSFGAAVVLSIAFWIVGGVFQQLGARGLLHPVAAAWIPAVCLVGVSVYLLSRIKT